ncbi:hypothetical protein HYT45_00875 [Candidatus Uhrbacteria bacterium]|nr:hypothetical protein [Candidatus Uhrbacteria bacterium]
MKLKIIIGLVIAVAAVGLLVWGLGGKKGSETPPPSVGSRTAPAPRSGEVVNCNSFLTNKDAQALGYDKVDVKRCDKNGYIATIGDASVQVYKNGKAGYENSLKANQRLFTEEVARGIRPKGTAVEENKYGERSFITHPEWGGYIMQLNIGVLKGQLVLSISAFERDTLKGDAIEALARKLAELLTPRLPE